MKKSSGPLFYDTFPTSFGDFSVVVNGAGAVVATAFGDYSRLQRFLNGREAERDASVIASLKKQILQYFAGAIKRVRFDLAIERTEFQGRVWKALMDIPYGETRNYRDVAEAIGSPKAFRAVGGANGANPVCLLIPCHRVIAADGSLGGFSFGLPVKKKLLELEGAL